MARLWGEGHRVGLLPGCRRCLCVLCYAGQAPSPPQAHMTVATHGCPVPCHQVASVPLPSRAGSVASTSAAWRGPCAPVPCAICSAGVTVPPASSDRLGMGQGWSWEHLAGLGAPRSSQTCPQAAGITMGPSSWVALARLSKVTPALAPAVGAEMCPRPCQGVHETRGW